MKNAQEQAFPRAGFSGELGFGKPTNGLTKREHFAALAMQGLCSADCDVPLPPDLVAMRAIEYADALLAELEKPQ